MSKEKNTNYKAIKNELDDLPDIVCEKEDLIDQIKDDAEFARNWINDGLLRRYTKKTGDKYLSARTRKLIKIKSYDTYMDLNNKVLKGLQTQKDSILSEIDKNKTKDDPPSPESV